MRASEGLLRGGIASELIHQLIAVFLVLALYRLFKRVDEALARQVVVLVLPRYEPFVSKSRGRSKSRKCRSSSGC
ncbi:MAG: hypothetical protein EHM78_11765 [Myxococcaceae bacterium]|nr:MAG: hypothetical protein EHM78_11765 [Myxococcaceae bacterium]